jgi:DNA-binding response OmpR family regulator
MLMQNSSPAQTAATGRPLHILVVEEDHAMRTLLEVLLREEGHAVRTPRHGLEAPAITAGWPLELVVLDLYLSVPVGEVTHMLRKAHGVELPVLAMSTTHDHVRAREVHAYALVDMPFDIFDFTTAIRSIAV